MARRGLRRDPGSGTVLGIGLIFLVGVFLGATALFGRVLVVQSRAQTAADVAAIAAAGSLHGMVAGESPCGVAAQIVAANAARLQGCFVVGSDVRVQVEAATGVPLPQIVESRSRAGPAECTSSS